MDILGTLSNLVAQTAFFNLTVGNYIMILVALFFLLYQGMFAMNVRKVTVTVSSFYNIYN